MKTFELIKELVEYIPNCIICGKSLRFSLDGRVTAFTAKNAFPRFVYLKMNLEDNILKSTSKRFPALSIDVTDNQILEGVSLLTDMTMGGWVYLKKKCSTCSLVISTEYLNNGPHNPKKVEVFPSVVLHEQKLHFTTKHSKPVDIQTYLIGGELHTSIRLNGKSLPETAFDLAKITNLDQLNRRIATIATFG